VGGLYRATGRDAQSLSYNISSIRLTDAQRELRLEQIFDGRFTETGASTFDIGPLSQGGSYVARDRLSAGFVMAEVPLGARLRVVGAHATRATGSTSMPPRRSATRSRRAKLWNDWLPSLAATFKLADAQQLGSRRRAPWHARSIASCHRSSAETSSAARTCRATRTCSAPTSPTSDLRWEMYPSAGETVSLAVFAKHFTNPIERVFGSGSGGTSFVFFTNAKAADNYGVELELRKGLGMLGNFFEPLSAFANATVMKSEIELAPNTAASATNLTRRMVGQAPYVLNDRLTYASPGGGTSATLFFNRVGERIAAAGASPLPDVVDRPRNVLDFSLRSKLLNGTTLRFDLKNLSTRRTTTEQGSVVREYYRAVAPCSSGVQLSR
jgi:hypothetical protein